MEDKGESPLPCLVLQNSRYVLVGVAGMDDQRQAGLPRGGNVATEAGGLCPGVALIVIVEANLADRNAARVLRQPDQVIGLDMQFLMRVVRMRADGAPDFGILFGNRAHLVEALDAGRDRDHPVDTIGARPGEHAGAVCRKSRWQWLSISTFSWPWPARIS